MASAGFGNLDGGAQQAYQFRARFIRPLGTEVEMASTDGAHYVRVGAGGVTMSAFPTVPGVGIGQVLGTNLVNTTIRGIPYTDADTSSTLVQRDHVGRIHCQGIVETTTDANDMLISSAEDEHLMMNIPATHLAVDIRRTVMLRNATGDSAVRDFTARDLTARNITYTGTLNPPPATTAGLPWAVFSQPLGNNIDIYSGGNLTWMNVASSDPVQNNPTFGSLSYQGTPVLTWRRRDYSPWTGPNLNHRINFPAGGRFFIQWQMAKRPVEPDIGAPFEAVIMANDNNNNQVEIAFNTGGNMPAPNPLVGSAKRAVAAMPTHAGSVTALNVMEIFGANEYITFKRNQWAPNFGPDDWNQTYCWAKVFYLGPA
jgi:hypothetical protein